MIETNSMCFNENNVTCIAIKIYHDNFAQILLFYLMQTASLAIVSEFLVLHEKFVNFHKKKSIGIIILTWTT